MRELAIVNIAPLVKRGLGFIQRPPGVITQEFEFECSMKALIFALGLRVIGP
jgi:hypothetical protein